METFHRRSDGSKFVDCEQAIQRTHDGLHDQGQPVQPVQQQSAAQYGGSFGRWRRDLTWTGTVVGAVVVASLIGGLVSNVKRSK